MKRILSVMNALLAVIAVCLLLIVIDLYGFTFVAPAQAQASTTVERTVSSTTPLPVQVVNDHLPCKVEGTVDARMHVYEIGWSPATGRYGALVVKAQE